ncbi:histone deacetylase [Cryptosporidium felis]|nr:histone deacetylase [Cryptosporidium felis]
MEPDQGLTEQIVLSCGTGQNDQDRNQPQEASRNIDIYTLNADLFNTGGNDDSKAFSEKGEMSQANQQSSKSNIGSFSPSHLDGFNPRPGLFQKLVHSRDSKGLREYIFSPMRSVINERDSSGCTALHVALLNAYPEMLEILLSSPREEPDSAGEGGNGQNGDEIPNNQVGEYFGSDLTNSHGVGLTRDSIHDSSIIPIDLSIPFAGIPVSQLVLCKAIFRERYDDCLNCLYLLLPFAINHDVSPYVSWLDLNATDQLGLTALHLACSFGDSKIASLLLEYGALATISDLNGDEPVHHAISSRDPVTFSVILSNGGGDPLKKSTSTAALIKYCIDRSAWRCLHTLLTDSEYHQHPISESEYDLLSFHAQKLGLDPEFTRVFSLAIEIAAGEELSQGVGENFIVDGPAVGLASTRIFTHGCCFKHISLPEPMDMPIRRSKLVNKIPENPTRMEVLVKPGVGILRSNEFSLLQWEESCRPALLSDILRVHDWAYVRLLQHKVEESRLIWDQRPFLTGSIDDDTQLTPESWKAAIHASGSVIKAVDCVCRGENRNAFCAIRPPGHHLGTWGAAQSVGTDEGIPSGSQGFCLLNNVAIGAAYCRYMYGSVGISKIAIIDFDVHHGNGTEQIVRNVCPGNRTIRTVFNPVPGVNLNLEQEISYYKIWRDEQDAENILFSSIHAYDGTFYPGTGPDQYIPKPNIINIGLPEKTSSRFFRSKIKRVLLPKLLQFRPDIIFISAGFDGHVIDIVGKGFTSCTEGDYAWLTQQLISIANLCCNGRIVSVLEGGYNTKALSLSPLAKSVAAHVRALQWTSPNLMPNPQEWEEEDEELEEECDELGNHSRGYSIEKEEDEREAVGVGGADVGPSSHFLPEAAIGHDSQNSIDGFIQPDSSSQCFFGSETTQSPSLKRYRPLEKSQTVGNPSNDFSSVMSSSQISEFDTNPTSNFISNRPRRAAAIKAEESIQKKIQSQMSAGPEGEGLRADNQSFQSS